MMIEPQTISDEATKLEQGAIDSASAADVGRLRAQCLAELGQQLSRQLGKLAANELDQLEPKVRATLLDKLDKLMVQHAKRWADTSAQARGMAEAKKQQAQQLRELVTQAETTVQTKAAAKKIARRASSKKKPSSKKTTKRKPSKDSNGMRVRATT